ncbi:response regulator transcription factor [Gammaproteobacteria bacterium LSUCC0057]|jgi:DNA-binding NarL/FixJ family response regulator|uniref:Response regulator transcription factor n=1 Tax=Gammaproteobacteria bacterium LSUCC0057 TaxID=2559237 RepID=A0A4Y8UJ46_9GAMM|nr:response regulator transcription factor [Gammaproteobacteria bacterium LSUCC0057]
MRILIVDDHAFVCAGLRATMLAELPGAEVFTADHGDTALQLLAANPIDVAIVDLFMPGAGGGFDFIQMLCESYPKLPVIILSASENMAHIRKCIDLGAAGFVPKSAPKETLFEAIAATMKGERFLPETIRETIPEMARIFNEIDIGLDYHDIADLLTNRQMDILHFVAEGRSNKEIAKKLTLSENTVKVHVSAILRALGLKNRTQIGVLGQRLELMGGASQQAL